MNIALFTEMMNIGGAAALVLRQARWLKAHGHRVVVASSGGALIEELQRDGIPHVLVGTFAPGTQPDAEELVADGAALERLFGEYAIEAIVAQAQLPFLFADAAASRRVPVFLDLLSPVYYVPKTPFGLKAVRDAAADGRILSGAVVASRAFAEHYGFAPTAPHLINVPIDPQAPSVDHRAMRASLGIDDATTLVITVARLDRDRAPMILPLARACAQLNARFKTRLLVVGDGTEMKKLQRSSPPQTIFTGFRRDLADLYAASDLFVGEGSVVQDAAAAGLPVVTTCSTVYRNRAEFAYAIFGMHLIDHFFTDTTNVVSPVPMKDALELVLSHPQRTAEFAVAGQRLIAQHWHVDTVMPQRLDVLADPQRARVPVGTCEVALDIPGGTSSETEAIASALARIEAPDRFGVHAARRIPWSKYFDMALGDVQALCAASWRMTYPPRTRHVLRGTVITPALPPQYADLERALQR